MFKKKKEKRKKFRCWASNTYSFLCPNDINGESDSFKSFVGQNTSPIAPSPSSKRLILIEYYTIMYNMVTL